MSFRPVPRARALPFILSGFVSVLGCLACHKGAPPPPAPAPAAVAPARPPIPREVRPRVEVAVTEQGFVPANIPARAGQPITLAITRRTEQTCATAIIFAGQEHGTELPLDKTIDVTYTPSKTGPLKFGCTMGMMVGGVLDVMP